jgi:hypothetical protein
VAMAIGLLVVAVLLLFSLNEFGGGHAVTSAGGGGGSGSPSILSRSAAETQIKLCAEGRDSTYGSPPSAAQQAVCVRKLLAEVSATGSSIPGTP